ncbi:MAG: TnpV protein [Acutalibacteraceae bacterium]|nr:TnpV protein [Acutalibacteraceae bacterium]
MTNSNITYTQQGDYLIPDLKLPEEKNVEIGVFGQRHKNYLLNHHKIRYYNLLTSCKLAEYLADVDSRANEMFFRLVNQMAVNENITEQIKTENPMLWVQSMNNIRNRATEIVNNEIIYT